MVGHRCHRNVYLDPAGIQDELDRDGDDGLQLPEIAEEEDEEEEENILSVQEVTLVDGFETHRVFVPTAAAVQRYFMTLP